jgi:hypothetical protein
LEYFRSLIGNSAKSSSYCSSTWFSPGNRKTNAQFGAVSTIVALQFPRIVTRASSKSLGMWMGVLACLHQRHWFGRFQTLRPMCKHYTTVCPYLAANCRWTSASFISSDKKKACLLSSVVVQSTLCHTLSPRLNCNWTTLAAWHCLTLSYSTTRSQHCCRSYSNVYFLISLVIKSYTNRKVICELKREPQ